MGVEIGGAAGGVLLLCGVGYCLYSRKKGDRSGEPKVHPHAEEGAKKVSSSTTCEPSSSSASATWAAAEPARAAKKAAKESRAAELLRQKEIDVAEVFLSRRVAADPRRPYTYSQRSGGVPQQAK